MASDTLWNDVQQLPCDCMRQVQSLYGTHFPIEVRHFFASWIEQQIWSSLEEDNPSHEELAAKLREDLIALIEEKAQELSSGDMFLTRLKLQETAQKFRDMYGTNPMNLVRVLSNCLTTEHKLVDHFVRKKDLDTDPMTQKKILCYFLTIGQELDNKERDAGVSVQARAHKLIQEEFTVLQSQTQESEEKLRGMLHEQESFILLHQEYTQINAQITSLQAQPNGQTRVQNEQRLQADKTRTEADLRRMAQSLLDMRLKLAKNHKEIFESLSRLQSRILDEQLIHWKRQQQLAGNGAPFDASLETLQLWCESLAELIWTNRQQIRKVEMQRTQLPIDLPPGEPDLMPFLNTTITGLLSSLVTSTFIIEKQPPQVLKKDAKFTATVRLLVGGRLNVHMNPPTVKATIISEEQAKSILKNDKNAKNESSGDIVNSQGQMEYHQSNGQLAIMFRNMQLKRIRRAEKKGNETVTEEKFSILFQSQFTVGGGELVFQVWTLSLPVVVTVHGNQECNALATILWDNAFAESGRIPFQVPEKVSWSHMSQALNTKFASACGRGLSGENINYLAFKLFGQTEDLSQPVSWAQFNREPLPGRNFTFWEWFYTIMKLAKDWLQGPWKENLIVGFISRQKAQDWLMVRPHGTFLMRFSDSEAGGITIAWVADDANKPGERQVWNLLPFAEKDFKIRSLGDRIKDLEHLTFLYPNIPKNEAFQKFWTQNQDGSKLTDDGYVPVTITTTMQGLAPCITTTSGASNIPAYGEESRSPQPFQPQSPAPTMVEGAYGHNPAQVSMDTMAGTMETEDVFPDFCITDYNPDDISSININELLGHTHPHTQ